MMPRPLPLLLVAISLLSAGCAGYGPTATTPSGTTTPTPSLTASPTETPWKSTAPDPSHEVRVNNQFNRSIDLRVFVVHQGTHVYDQNLTVAPGERTVYNTIEANPEGEERFRVVAVWNGTQADTYLRTTNCYASAEIWVTPDDGLSVGTVLC